MDTCTAAQLTPRSELSHHLLIVPFFFRPALRSSNGATPVEVRLVVALRMLAGANYMDIGILFGIAFCDGVFYYVKSRGRHQQHAEHWPLPLPDNGRRVSSRSHKMAGKNAGNVPPPVPCTRYLLCLCPRACAREICLFDFILVCCSRVRVQRAVSGRKS